MRAMRVKKRVRAARAMATVTWVAGDEEAIVMETATRASDGDNGGGLGRQRAMARAARAIAKATKRVVAWKRAMASGTKRAMVWKRAMVRAARAMDDDRDNDGDGGKGNVDGDEGERQQQGRWQRRQRG